VIPAVTECTGCLPAGASCAGGLLLLAPNFYRPQELAGEPFGPTTKLYPCYNGESCIVDQIALTHSCAPGYSGPLCSVCDTSMHYGRNGDKCSACPSPAATWSLLATLFVLCFAWLLRVALRDGTSRKSGASIALKIAMGFVQAIGSLKAFKAGGTAAYRGAMGWTDAVSSSPLSVNAVQCVWDSPMLLTFIVTCLLPLLASVAVILLFICSTALRECRLQRTCMCRFGQFTPRVLDWWRRRQMITTLVFVLFIAYIAIMSASLRVFDCYHPAINGVVYLREDMRVVCGEGQHAVAQVLAGVTLLALGLGFPLLVYRVLSRATTVQLNDEQFYAKWGFLYDGYCTGTEAANTLGSKSPSTSVIVPGVSYNVSWWESIVLVRKVGIVLLAVLVPNAYLQNGGAALWLGGFLCLQIKVQPYKEARFNWLELLSLAASTATAIITSMLLQNDVTDPSFIVLQPKDMDTSQWCITIALLLINFVTFGILATTWLVLASKHATQRVRQRWSRRWTGGNDMTRIGQVNRRSTFGTASAITSGESGMKLTENPMAIASGSRTSLFQPSPRRGTILRRETNLSVRSPLRTDPTASATTRRESLETRKNGHCKCPEGFPHQHPVAFHVKQSK
jgi:hypothetical protein